MTNAFLKYGLALFARRRLMIDSWNVMFYIRLTTAYKTCNDLKIVFFFVNFRTRRVEFRVGHALGPSILMGQRQIACEYTKPRLCMRACVRVLYVNRWGDRTTSRVTVAVISKDNNILGKAPSVRPKRSSSRGTHAHTRSVKRARVTYLCARFAFELASGVVVRRTVFFDGTRLRPPLPPPPTPSHFFQKSRVKFWHKKKQTKKFFVLIWNSGESQTRGT